MKKITLWIFLCVCLSALSVLGQKNSVPKSILPVAQVETLKQQMNRIARRYGLDERLFQSLVYTESTFKSRAVSSKGAACYTQLMPETARRFGLRVDAQVDERFNTEKCLSAGAYYLAWLIQNFRGDVRLALAGYNAGEGAVIKYGWRVPPFQETVQYVEKICALYYGQSGHGVAMAYNQPLAQFWVNRLYAVWRPRVQRASPSPSNLYLTAAQAERSLTNVPPADQNPNAAATGAALTEAEKKKVRIRVNLDETVAPRINTQSLSFQ